MKQGVYFNKKVETSGYISSIHHKYISTYQLTSWSALDIVKGKLINGRFKFPFSKEFQTLLSECYVEAFKKVIDFEIPVYKSDSFLYNWDGETDYYAGLKYKFPMPDAEISRFHNHCVKKGIAQKRLSYIWILEEHIIPLTSKLFTGRLNKVASMSIMENFDGTTEDCFKTIYNLTNNLTLSTDITAEYVKTNLNKRINEWIKKV
jgi:hypothetical protein